MAKKVISIILALVMALSLFTAVGVTCYAESDSSIVSNDSDSGAEIAENLPIGIQTTRNGTAVSETRFLAPILAFFNTIYMLIAGLFS